MNMVMIDTHEVVLELRAAGFTEAQAEAVTRIVRKAQDIDLCNLATKANVAATRADVGATRADVAALRTATTADIEASRAATKIDMEQALAEIRLALERGLAAAKLDLERGLAALRDEVKDAKNDNLKWIVSSLGLQTVVILGAMIVLFRMVKP